MSSSTDDLDRQIAALEAALKLSLPEGSRVQIELDLRALRTLQSASTSGLLATTDVSGTLYGSAIGVNLGSVQTYFGSTPLISGDLTTSQVTQEDIDDQRELLDAHRRTLAVYLKQKAKLGSAYVPPGVENGLNEARGEIRRIKAILRGWNIPVEDHPNDLV